MVGQEVDLRRTGAAIGVIALHAAILILFLRATFHMASFVPNVHETIVRLLPLPLPKSPEQVHPVPRIPVINSLPRTAAPLAPPPIKGSAEGLHQDLFNCAPENLDKLTPDERAQCTAALAPHGNEGGNVLNLPSRAHDAPHWQRALARKQNPLLLPCANRAGLPLTLETVTCVANGALKGFGDLDEAPGYGDAPTLGARVPNNGDPPGEPAHH